MSQIDDFLSGKPAQPQQKSEIDAFLDGAPEPGLAARLKQGASRAYDSARTALTDDRNKIAQIAAEQARTALPQTETQRKMAEEIAPYSEAASKAEGVVDNVKAWGALGFKRAGQLISNPAEAGKMIAEQLPNSLPGIAGGLAGAKAGAALGSVAGPVGTVVGGIGGAILGGFAGGYGLEKGAAAQEQVQQEAQKRGIDVRDSAQVSQMLQQNYPEIEAAAQRKGLGTAGTDAVLNAATMGLAGVGGRTLAKEASALAKGVKAGTVSAADAATELARLEAINAARNTLAARAMRGAGVVGAEMAGGGLSEAAGQNLAYGKVNPGEVIDEALLDIGSGGAMALGSKAFNKAAGVVDQDAATRDLAAARDGLPGLGPNFTTSPGAADPNAPVPPGAAPVEAPDLQTSLGAGVPRDGMDFTREVDTSGLSLEDPAEVERDRAARMDYQPGDTMPQWDTAPGVAQDRMPGLDMPEPTFDTGNLGLESRSREVAPLSVQMGLDPSIGALTAAAAKAVDSGASALAQAAQEARLIGATGRDVQVRPTGPGVTNDSNVIDVQGRVIEDRAIGTQRRLTAQESARESGAIAFREGVPRSEIAAIPNVIHRAQQLRGYDDAAQKASSVPALPAPTNLREGLERIRAQKQEAANAQAAQAPVPAAAPVPGPAAAPAVEAAGLNRPKSARKAAEFDARKAAEIEAGALGAQEAEAAGVPTQFTWPAHRKWVYSQAPRMTLREFQVALKGRHGMSGPEIGAYYKSSNGGAEVSAAKITTEGTANVHQAAQAQQASPQPAQAVAAPAAEPATSTGTPTPAGTSTVRALTDATPTADIGAQAAPAPGPQAATADETREQRAKRVASAGQVWTRLGAIGREALVARAPGLNPIQRKRIPSAAWDDLHTDIQRNLADAMGGREEYGGNSTGTIANATPVAIKSEAQNTGKDAVRIGRDQTPLNEGGKPFKTRKAAGDAKKLQPMMRVVTVPGGYALTEKTPAQLAAEERASRRLRNPNTSAPGEPIPAHAFIAAAGGLNRVAAADMGVDGNPRIGNRTLFAGQGRGLSMEQATQMLIQDGYLNEGATINDALSLIKTSLTRPQYNADGIERIAEAEAQAQFEDYLAAQEEVAQDDEFDPFGPAPATLDGFSDDMLESSGYDAATDAIKAEVRALLEMANAQGIDTESIMLEAHEQTRNATEQDYYEAAKSALEAAITGSNRDRGTPAGSEGQGPGAAAASAAEQGLNQPVALNQQAQAATENVAQTVSTTVEMPPTRQQESSPFARFATGRYRISIRDEGNGQYAEVVAIQRGSGVEIEMRMPGEALEHPAFSQLNARVQALFETPTASMFDAEPPALELAAQTPAEAAAQQAAQEQAAKAEAARQRAADAQAARDEERKRIAQASVRAADNFELGQDPLDSLTGQGGLMFSRTGAGGAQSGNAKQATAPRTWYDRFVSLLPESYRNDPHRREPLPAEDWNVQRSSEVRVKVEALNKQLRGENDRKGYGPISIDGLGNLQVDARDVSAADLSGSIKALADALDAGIAVTGVGIGDAQALLAAGFVFEPSLAAIADRLMNRPFAAPDNVYAKDAAPGTVMTYKPRGFPAALFSRQRMTDAERRATPPSATADVADSDVVVTFNGNEMRSAPLPANAAQAQEQATPRTPVTAIRAAITKAYGKLLGQLESKGLVTLTQTEDEAIEAAAQARAAKTGGDVEAIKRSMINAMRGETDLDVKRSANGAIQGFFDPQTGQSFLIADNLTAEAAPGVLMHEVGIHMAADGSMKALFNRAAMMLKMQRGNQFIKQVQARMDAAGETSGEEAAAYIAEAYENDRANAPASVQRWLADLLAAVKAWMFKKGIMGADRLTVADIAAVARANARSMARDGGADRAGGGDVRFSRASQAKPAEDTSNPDSGNSSMDEAGSSAWDAPVQTGFDDVIYKLQDKNIDLKRVVESIAKATGKVSDSINAYLKEELFHKRAAKRVADFGDRELKPLMNKMRLAGLSMEDVEEYLHARHAKEANAVIAQRNPGNAGLQDGGSGMTNAAADNYFAKLDPAQRRKLEAVAKSVDAIIDGTRKLYVDYGLEDQAVVDGWASMYQHYIPLMREDKDGGMGTGQGFSVKGKETKGRTGSTRKVVDILANVAMQREKLIVRGEKNIVAQALVGLAQANPNPDFWDVRSQAPTERVFDPKTGVVVDRPDPLFKSRENVAVAKVKDANGKVTEQMVVFNEDNPRAVRMAAAMKNLDAGNLEGLLGVSAKITRYFAAINTQYNPVFGVVNLVRDVQGAMVNLGTTPLAGQQGKIAKDTLSALRGIYGDIRKTRKGGQATSQWSQLWEQMQDDGGTTGYRDLFKTSADRANDLKSILNPDGWMDSKWGKFFTADGRLKVPMSMAQKGASELFGWLSDYNEAMENGVRLAAYKAALDKGMTREQAASLAKNLTVNFNRKGQAGQQAGAVYAFFNAAMQGTARIGQTLFDMDGGDLSTLRLSKTGKAVVYGGVMLGVMQALALSAAGFDDDDPPEFVRERSLIIPTGDKTYVSIPMPLGLHVIPGIGRHATEFALSGFDKPAKRAVSMVGMFADAFNPIGNAGLSMQTIAPTALDPLVALSENKDWTGKPIARVSSNKAMPGHTQWKDTATGFSKVVAEAINWISGGNEYVAGAFSPTPDQIDYLIAQLGGGVAREAAKVQQTVSSTLSGEELPTYKVPLVGRFVGNAASQASQGSAFYANLNKLNELETEIKGLRKDGRFDEASKLTRENPQSILIAMANRAERDVQRLRREKRELIANDASREQVRAKEQQITAVMTRLNEAAARRLAPA